MAGAEATSGWSGLLAVLVLGGVAVAGAFAVHRVTAVAPRALTAWPWLSGWHPAEHALSRYHARWYPATVVFLGVLLLGVLWARREGAFSWQ